MLFTILKYKKALTAILKGNLRFKRLRLNYKNNQKKQTEKERLRLVISSIRVGVVAKTDDEVCLKYTVLKKVQLLKISKVMYLLWKSLPPCKNDREEDNKFSGRSLLHPAFLQKRVYQFFWSSFGRCPLQFPDQLPYDWLNLGLEILPVLQRIFTCFWKTAIKTMNFYQMY